MGLSPLLWTLALERPPLPPLRLLPPPLSLKSSPATMTGAVPLLANVRPLTGVMARLAVSTQLTPPLSAMPVLITPVTWVCLPSSLVELVPDGMSPVHFHLGQLNGTDTAMTLLM